MKLHRFIIALFVLALGAATLLASDTNPRPTGKPSVSGVVSNFDAAARTFTLTSGNQSYLVSWNNNTKISGEGQDGGQAFVEYPVGVRLRGNPARVGAIMIRFSN